MTRTTIARCGTCGRRYSIGDDGFYPDWRVHPGELIKEQLAALGLSQNALCDASGLSKWTVSRIVNGHQPITPAIAVRLEGPLDVRAEFLARLQVNFDVHKARELEDSLS